LNQSGGGERYVLDPGKLKPGRTTVMDGTRVSEGYTLPRFLWKEDEQTILEALGGNAKYLNSLAAAIDLDLSLVLLIVYYDLT